MNMDLDDFDFGFTTHSEEDITPPTDDRAEQMFKAILPLLRNLQKDADKNPYIKWPDRKEKIEAFISKLQAILEQ